MAKVINRGKETIHVGGHVLGSGEHDLPDFETLAKQYPGLDKLVEVVEPEAKPESKPAKKDK
jgi:hypothetical protein